MTDIYFVNYSPETEEKQKKNITIMKISHCSNIFGMRVHENLYDGNMSNV